MSNPRRVHATSGQPGDRRLRTRLATWWNNASLRLSFTVYVLVYLVIAFVGSLASSVYFTSLADQATADYYELSGLYLFDPDTNRLYTAHEIEVAAQDGTFSYPLFVQSAHSDRPFIDVADLPADVCVDYVGVDYFVVDTPGGSIDLEFSTGFGVLLASLGEDASERFGDALTADNLAAFDAAQRAYLAQCYPEAYAALAEGNLDRGVLISPVGYCLYVPPSDGAATMVTALEILSFLMFPLWFCVCIWAAGQRFYTRRIKPALLKLEVAADMIASQDLDFTASYPRNDEMGRLVRSFETMRSSLAQTQRTLWRTAEERKRLNAAFAHDLRTPLTVLHGTVELLAARTAGAAAVDPARLADDCATLLAQVERLERYVDAMGGIGRLEDREIVRAAVPLAELTQDVRATGEAVCGRAGISFTCTCADTPTTICVDRSAVLEVAENLAGNAARYASARVEVALAVETVPVDGSAHPGRQLVLTVRDDGPGFSAEALRRGRSPFFSESKDRGNFGLGLNIATMLCEKHAGSLELGNAGTGGALVTARFAC